MRTATPVRKSDIGHSPVEDAEHASTPSPIMRIMPSSGMGSCTMMAGGRGRTGRTSAMDMDDTGEGEHHAKR